uniref:CDT1 Geminin-binding domain-containing protein n=2 Tax=Kalanchoe fedtschenkoi TaxID=63787 RepID=A0A7N0V5Y2_KALFE
MMESAASPKSNRSTGSRKNKTMSPLSSKTPEKPMQQRGRNRGVALSVKEIRRVAKGLRDSDPDGAGSTKRQLLSSPIGKLKTADESGSRSINLPEKYEMLWKTFHSLDCVVRLMRMKGVSPSFSNVSPKVADLTDRRFTYEQLAQLKFILPEAIVLKKVSVFDETTSCMKFDIHISLESDAFKTDVKGQCGAGKMQLSKVFRLRLLDFFKSHPEGTEIPVGPLPEPFGRQSEGASDSWCRYDPTNSPSGAQTVSNHLLEEKKTASHLSHSFRRHFSKKVGSQEEARTYVFDDMQTSELAVKKSRLSRCAVNEEPDIHVAPSMKKSSTEIPNCDSDVTPRAPCLSSSSLLATPCKDAACSDNLHTEKTPSKHDSNPGTPMTTTPASLTPKRWLMSPDDDDTTKTSNKLVRRALRTRSLKFDAPVEDAEAEGARVKPASCSSTASELVDILDEDLLQSIMEKERKTREESDPAISQAKKRRDMIAALPKLFNMVHFYFQSMKRSVVTKEEFLHGMISSHSDFLDRREVEEQLKLLQELAPEYISESIALSGDCLLRVNKASNAESIRARLAGAR